MSMKNPTEIYDGKLVMVSGNKPIIHWALAWRYTFMIYNNSKDAAYNVKVENISDIEFAEFEKLDKINNILPIDSKGLKIKSEDSWKATIALPINL